MFKSKKLIEIENRLITDELIINQQDKKIQDLTEEIELAKARLKRLQEIEVSQNQMKQDFIAMENILKTRLNANENKK